MATKSPRSTTSPRRSAPHATDCRMTRSLKPTLLDLREDAATSDLDLRVIVRRGLAHLRGAVPTIDDAGRSEAVAWRAAGATRVRELLGCWGRPDRGEPSRNEHPSVAGAVADVRLVPDRGGGADAPVQSGGTFGPSNAAQTALPRNGSVS